MKYAVRNWVIAVVILAASVVLPASAEAPDRSLGISPLRSELTILPGTSFDGTLTLTNSGKQSVSVSLVAEAFSVTNQVYDYSFDATGKGADWTSFSQKTLDIEPGKSATVSYKVSVPIDAEPGGRYISLFASSSPVTSNNGVTSVNRVASLLYITVAGDITQTGNILTFNSPLLSFTNPSWTAAIQNNGSAHFHSLYNVQVKSLFGGTSLGSSQGDSLILPSSVRLVSQKIPNLDVIGIYRLDYTIGLGDVSAYQETRWMFYVPPLQLLLLISIVIGILLLRTKKPTKNSPKQDT